MSGRIFGRACSATLARPLSPEAYFSTAPNALVVTALRMSFLVEKTLRKEPNTAELSIWNLSEATRKEIERKPLYVRIDAGYDGRLERVFTGNLRFGESEKTGENWITRLDLADGDRAFRFARVNRSFKPGVTARTAIREAARAMGLEAQFSDAAGRELDAQFVSGLAMFGGAADEITRLLSAFGMSWSIQDGSLQILRAGEHRANEAIVISQDSGLEGPPAFGAPTRKRSKPILKFESKLKPPLSPGGRVSLVSERVTGIFKLERVTHRGDTHEGEWNSSCEAVAA
jgi:hypothetical protein